MEGTIFHLIFVCSILGANGAQDSCAVDSEVPYDQAFGERLQQNSDRPITSIQFVGAHNAGANTDSSVGQLFNCFARNQDYSFTKMLNLGVRYFDIDICYHQDTLKLCHVNRPYDEFTSHFFGELEPALKEIKCFIKAHPKEAAFLHFNRDWHAYGPPEAKQTMATALYQMLFEYLGDVMFPLEEFHKTNGRVPTVNELWDARQPVLVFVHETLYELARKNMAAEIVQGPANANRWIDIIYMAYRPVSTLTGVEIQDEKLVEVDGRCGRSEMPFIDFQVIGKAENLRHCLTDISSGTKKILPAVEDLCRSSRCAATDNKKSINFLTIDYVNTAPASVYEEFNLGDCNTHGK